MKKRYTFLALLAIMLYLIYLVLSYKYTEYKIFHYVQELSELNESYLENIKKTQEILETKNTAAYKNKVLKAQANKKNPGEEVVVFISEERYNTFTQVKTKSTDTIVLPQNILNEESLIQSMSVYERWIYLLFGRDIR